VHILKGRILSVFRISNEDKNLAKTIKHILGIQPFNINLYRLATQHSSVAKENIGGIKESNERLEYLGDAILSLIVADYLFKRYPYKEEGFLTEIRSRIVSRESLNQLGKKIGLEQVIAYHETSKHFQAYKSIMGDTLEALIGAVYLDKGYRACKKFVLKKLISPYLDIENIVTNNPNFKSRVIEWAHRNNKSIEFVILDVIENRHYKEFIAQVLIDNEAVGKGAGYSKKSAEQDAASNTCEILKI
jgi:ribonuclease III